MLAVLVATANANLEISTTYAKLAAQVWLGKLTATAILTAIVAVQPFIALLAFLSGHLAATAARA